MLTSQQLNKLIPLTLHVKYGKIISDAIEIWKKENICPSRFNFGLDFLEETFKLYKHKNKENPNIDHYCCLIGAALVGKENKTSKGISFNSLVQEIYNVEEEEILDLMRGFDRKELLSGDESEAFKFGFSIQEALWLE